MDVDFKTNIESVLSFAKSAKVAIDSVQEIVKELESNEESYSKEDQKTIDEAKKKLSELEPETVKKNLEEVLSKLSKMGV